MSTTPVPPIRDRAGLIAAIAGGWRPKYLHFWGHKGTPGSTGPHVLSQWWPAPFAVDGVAYPTAEHYMMAEKSRLFDDEAALARVLAASSPGAAKAAGREVRGFDDARWAASRFQIVTAGSLAKFEQNATLGAYLLATGDKVLVEASPVDRVWGIGLARDDAAASDPQRWRGENLLGFALMEARRVLGARTTGR
jgi:hypothetical protein